jgi:ABC-type cobalt transport system substrate-binding protein
MSRTINGNLTGRAASIQQRELRDSLFERELREREEFKKAYLEATETLQAIDPDFETWFWACPEKTKGEMLPLMESRIHTLKNTAEFEICTNFVPQEAVLEGQD